MPVLNRFLFAALLLLAALSPAAAQVNLALPSTSTTMIGKSDVPTCIDAFSQHLNYTGSAFACGNSGGGIVAFQTSNTTLGSISTSSVYVGLAVPNTAFNTATPFVSPGTVNLINLTCYMNGGPGAGNVLSIRPVVGAGGSGTGIDNFSQEVRLSGTTASSTVTTNIPITANQNDIVSLHVTPVSGVIPNSPISCSLRAS